jgi:Methyltransferase domain
MRNILFQYYLKNSVGAEIGVWEGAFSQELLTKVQPKKLYLIDPWKTQNYTRRWYSKDNTTQDMMDRLYEHVQIKFKNHPEVIILRDYSNNAFCTIVDDELDWVYIDGNHSENEVYEDLCSSYRKVKSGGYITGDDFFWVDPDTDTYSVKNAVDRFLTTYLGKVKILNIENGQYIIKKD